MSTSPEPTLAGLRSEIDRIDSAMHALLIERGLIIDRLIEIKARQGGGSAFRPAREASMMRTLAERHRGRLPLDTVESIWRIIISTFTYIQAPYSVHVDVSRGEAAIRDSARFHFGFTVPCVAHRSSADVIAAVAEFERGFGNVPARWQGRRPAPGGRGSPRPRLPKSSRACRSSSGRIIRQACRSSSFRSLLQKGRLETSFSIRLRLTSGGPSFRRRYAALELKSLARRPTGWALPC